MGGIQDAPVRNQDQECTVVDIIRKPRVFDMPLFDWVASLAGAFVLGYFLGIRSVVYWILWILAWTFFGVAVHYIIGVDTMFGYYLGLNPKPKRKNC
jgi:hypothetical protein